MNYPIYKNQIVAIDIETKEEQDIKHFGSGAHRHYLEGEDSYILGIAVSAGDKDYYFEACQELYDWLISIQEDNLFLMHNSFYDMSWLWYEGFRPKTSADTMGLVRMLYEDRMQYNLDSCARDFLHIRKGEPELEAWCKENGYRGKPQRYLHLMPFELVAKYAKMDTRITLDLYNKLIPQIEQQDLSYIWSIETRLLPILWEINHRGIRIDEEWRLYASDMLGTEIDALKKWLYDRAGEVFNTNSSKQKKVVFDKLGLEYGMTEKGNPSFRSEDMLPYGVEPDMEYFPHVLVTHNKLLKLKRDFIDRLSDFIVCGRIHPTMNPYGTKTGRPSSNNPNVFQIPKKGRGKEICRRLFLPEEGEVWVSDDVASEEYRIFAHYASGPGSDNYREKYNTIPGYDMHTENAKLAGCDRTKAKTIGLGVLFGMGQTKMALNLGVGQQKGLEIVKKFHRVNPSFSHTAKRAQHWAEQHGYMRTLSKRRRRFPHGEGAYKALNFLTQGNSADYAKIIIVRLKELGVLDSGPTLLLWLYDELDFSCKEEDLYKIAPLFELANTALPLKVKMELGFEVGPNWGEIKERSFEDEIHKKTSSN
jgi:DNA polymerase-1